MICYASAHARLTRLGIDGSGAGLHAFRHGHETFLDRRNTPVAVRLERLGHSDTRMMVNYSHVIGEDDRKIAAELGIALQPSSASYLRPNENGSTPSQSQAVGNAAV